MRKNLHHVGHLGTHLGNKRHRFPQKLGTETSKDREETLKRRLLNCRKLGSDDNVIDERVFPAARLQGGTLQVIPVTFASLSTSSLACSMQDLPAAKQKLSSKQQLVLQPQRQVLNDSKALVESICPLLWCNTLSHLIRKEVLRFCNAGGHD